MKKIIIGGGAGLLLLTILQVLIVAVTANGQITTFQADQNFINGLTQQILNSVSTSLRLAGDANGVPSSNTVQHFNLTADSNAAGHSILAIKNLNGLTSGSKIDSFIIGSISPDAGIFTSLQVTLQGAGCAQFDASGNLTSTGTNCGSGGGGVPPGNAPQFVGYSALNTGEAE